MNRVQSLTQAYSQAPWRKQLQWIGLFMLVLILAAIVAGIYLSVSAEASSNGRAIQAMYAHIDRMEREIEDQKTQLALLTSNDEMAKRAEALGFLPVKKDEVLYIVVPGYKRSDQPILGSPPGSAVPGAAMLSPEYTQSLFEWLRERIFEPAAPLVQEVRP
jgi:cell division protein FtsL